MSDLGHLFDDAHNGAFFKIIGTKIQDKLREARQTRPEENARRWGWELLQNAKDVAHEGQPVRVAFQLSEESSARLVARHTGKPFRPDQLFYLIVQTSSKERPTGEAMPTTTGRYGTGFLTTHLLSRVVEVSGVLEAPGESPAAFAVDLDRSGDTLDDLTAAVKEALSIRDRFASLPRLGPVVPDAFNTSFSYALDATGLEVARRGIEDLHRSVPVTLAFTESVGEVTVQGVTYRRESRSPLGESIERVHVTAQPATGEPTSMWFVLARGEKTSVAVRVNASEEQVTVLPLGDEVPRLFCDFPLLGSEAFPLPFAVNSPWFYPDDARSGIYLENDSDAEVGVNRAALAEVPALLGALLGAAEAGGWHDRYHLAAFGMPTGLPARSTNWYQKTVLAPARDALLTAPLVETPDGAVQPLRKPLLGSDRTPIVWLPAHTSAEVREGLWRFAIADERYLRWLPKAEHLDAWSEIAWDDCAHLTPTRLVTIITEAGNVPALAKRLGRTPDETLPWLGDVAAFLVKHNMAGLLKPHQGRVQTVDAAGRYSWTRQPVPAKILPNQHGTFCSSADLFVDDELSEALKDIAAGLGHDVRLVLLDPSIDLDGSLLKGVKTSKVLAQTIEKAVKERISGGRTEETRQAFRALYLWMRAHDAEARDLFGMWLYEHRALLVPPEDVIELMDRVPHLERENATLREEAATLRADQAELQQQAEAATADAQSYRQLQAWLKAEGVDFGALPALLGDLRELRDQDRLRGLNDEDQELVRFVEEVREQFKDIEITSAEAFQAFVSAHPELFQHHAVASRYFLFLQKAERARTAVLEHLRKLQHLYEVKDWTPCPARPTVVLGVRRLDRTHSRPVHLVIRPSDGGRVIFYHREELAALTDPEAELWIEDPQRGVRRLTLGDVLLELRDRMRVQQVPVA